MTVCADEKVLRFQVAVNDILLVQMVEDEDEVRDVEASNVGGEATGSAEMREQLAALDKLEEHVQVRLVLKSTEAVSEGKVSRQGQVRCCAKARKHAQVDDERVVHVREGAPLRIDMLDLPEPDDRTLLEDLERKVERLWLVRATRRHAKANQDDSAESAGASKE